MNPVSASIQGELVACNRAYDSCELACGVISVSCYNAVKMGKACEPPCLIVGPGRLLVQPVRNCSQAVCGIVGVCNRARVRVGDLGEVPGRIVGVSKSEALGVGIAGDPSSAS